MGNHAKMPKRSYTDLPTRFFCRASALSSE
jgi:hypothetical protein